MEKQCSMCEKIKDESLFFKCKTSKDGLRYQCIECHYQYQKDPNKRAIWSARYYKKAKETNPELFMFKQAKHRSLDKAREMEFNIELKDIVIPELCPYLQVPFVLLDPQLAPSLDRIDSTKGYVKGNIQVITRLANIMKNNATIEQLVQFAKGVLVVHSKEEALC